MWTRFMDMHSGGEQKEPYSKIYIEATYEEAKAVFWHRFKHNPDRVTCTCCGEDYSISSDESLKRITGHDRGCKALETPLVDGRYKEPDDPWFREHYYLDPEDEAEALKRGYKISKFSSWGAWVPLEEYLKSPSVIVIRASEIKDEERTGDIPEQGYVWKD